MHFEALFMNLRDGLFGTDILDWLELSAERFEDFDLPLLLF